MRYLITDGNSIFGKKMIELLLSKTETEKIFATKRSDEDGVKLDKLEWVDLDLRNVEDTNRVVKDAKADIIFDFVSQESVSLSWQEPAETVDINVVGTINLLNAVRDYSPNSRLVIDGSGEEYGHVDFDDLPIKEDAVPKPDNIFGATKACQTMFAKLYYQAFGLDIIILRTFNKTSALQDERFAVSSFCKQFAEIEAGKREPVIYTGNLDNIRDFTDVDDLIRAFDLVAEKGKSGEVYNAARGEATTLMDIINILEQLTGIKVRIVRDADRVRPMDAPAMYADVSKLREDTGWKADISVEEMVRKIINNYRSNM